MRLIFATALATSLVWAPSLSAQNVLSGQVEGSVTNPAGRPLPNVFITLRSDEAGLARSASSGLDGTFAFDLVAPGRYTVRAEVIGYRPVVVTNLEVDAGGFRSVAISLQPAEPPVTIVDTLRRDPGVQRWTAHGPRTLTDELGAFQDFGGSVTALSRLSPDLDTNGGALGLPGASTPYVVDGVPFFRAAHPARLGDDLGSPAFPTAFLRSGQLSRRATDVELLMTPGATITADTRSTPRGGGATNFEGAFSGGPLWSSGILNVDSPELTSYRALGEGTVELVPERSRLYVAGEVADYETPLERRLGTDSRDALEPFSQAVQDLLLVPSVERTTRYSGMARLDRWGETNRLTFRASGGHAVREYSQAAPGWLDYGVAVPESTTEVSTALGYSSQVAERYAFEALAGVSYSRRVFGDESRTQFPPAFLTGPGRAIGPPSGSGAFSSRLDGFASSSFRFPLLGGGVRAGVSLHVARHSMLLFSGNKAPDLAFSDLAAAGTGQGAYRTTSVDQTFFTVPRLGAFAQYTWRPSPEVQILIGGRFDYMTIPTDELSRNPDWLRATGDRNDDINAEHNLPSGHFALTWDVTGDGSTILSAGAAVAQGEFDPAILHEAFARDGAVTTTRGVGAGAGWPDGGFPAGAREEEVLTLLGPDYRPPRTVTIEGALTQSLGAGWSLYLSGMARNTDFIARRRDLNLPTFAPATDAYGRPVMGSLNKLGSVVVAQPGSNRRLGGFDAVWAMDPDGYSRYWGASFGLGYATDATDLYFAYTRSETRDNWLGAREGLPDAQLDPGLTAGERGAWSEGISDFDIPDRLVAAARTRVELGTTEAEISAVYRWQSGTPFTPGYRVGVDANGDGSFRNDVAFVPAGGELDELAGEWSCLSDQAGGFAERNSCRGPNRSTFDASVRLGLTELGGRRLWLTVEGFNLIESEGGIVDDALLLVGSDAALEGPGADRRVTLPVTVNPDFGEVILPAARGRILRVGVRVGG